MPERSDLESCNIIPKHRRKNILVAKRNIKTCITSGAIYSPIRIQGDYVNFIDDSGYELCLHIDNFEK